MIFNIAQVAYKKDIKDLSSTTINAIFAGLARFKQANPRDTTGKVEAKFLALIKDISQSNLSRTVVGRAYLALSSKDVDGALVTIADLNLIDKRTLSENEVLVSNSFITKEFIE